MPILIIITTILSIFIAFLSTIQISDNAFIAYYAVLGNFFIANWLYLVVGFLTACFVFLKVSKLGDEYSRANKYLISAFQVGASFFAGTFFAYVVLLVVAWVELNALAVVIDINPALLGVVSDTPTIVATLKQDNNPPQIVTSEMDNYAELLGIAKTTTGTSNVYGASLLSSVPSLLVLPIIEPPSSMMLIDNTLIVTKVNMKDLAKVSPIIGELLVQQYFPTRKIKAYPKFVIMTPSQYTKVRSAEYATKLVKIDDELQTITSDISSLSASIKQDKENIASTQQEIDSVNKQDTSQYSACVNAGYYDKGVYIRYHTKDYCQTMLKNLQNQPISATTNLDTWQKQLSYDQDQLANYEYYQKFFTTQQQVMQVTRANIPYELGLFTAPDKIEIVINTKGNHAIANYIETVAHEYLHYASYVPKKSFNSAFFEEGLTEYFARQTIKDNLNVETNLGYPVYVKIISEMTKIIPESELADIYFTKDEVRLEQTLDRVYGDGFYQNNLILFATLQYASDPKQILQTANTIMKKIGGNPLTMKDLLSSAQSL